MRKNALSFEPQILMISLLNTAVTDFEQIPLHIHNCTSRSHRTFIYIHKQSYETVTNHP